MQMMWSILAKKITRVQGEVWRGQAHSISQTLKERVWYYMEHEYNSVFVFVLFFCTVEEMSKEISY